MPTTEPLEGEEEEEQTSKLTFLPLTDSYMSFVITVEVKQKKKAAAVVTT